MKLPPSLQTHRFKCNFHFDATKNLMSQPESVTLSIWSTGRKLGRKCDRKKYQKLTANRSSRTKSESRFDIKDIDL